jgi:CopA family copper-resistance protein
MTQNLFPPGRPRSPTRRRFVQGLAALGGTAAFGPGRALADGTEGSLPVLSGTQFDLTTGSLPFNVTGRPRVATAVNGSVPAPILRLREGDDVTINVTNRLDVPTSIHWHGLILPNAMDGVPGLTYRGIMPGETFTYRFPIKQAGTYWYHSHSGMQEQTGLYGPLVLLPREAAPYAYDREYVIMLSDWTDEDPMTVVSNLKQQSDYYNYGQRTLATFISDSKERGLKATLDDRMMWGKMRMSPTDIMDVTGATYTFLINGRPPAVNWTALFKPGEKIRLRFINGSSMTTFDVRIPGLPLKIVAADGSDVQPVNVGEFRIAVAETYDVIVEPRKDAAYTIFAQAEDRSGYARATLAPHPGMSGAIPPMDPRPLRGMADMGMGGMAGMSHGGMAGMDHGAMDMPGMKMSGMDHGAMAHDDMAMGPAKAPVAVNADGVDPKTLSGAPAVANVAMQTKSRQDEPGAGLENNGRRVLVYTDLKALKPDMDMRPVAREIEFHLTGNMERFIWGFDGKKFSESSPVMIKLGERVRFVLINDTMMEHPIHLHGYLFSVENGNDGRLPLKHTINVKPAERVSFVFTADAPGRWAFHCHLLYHMETGMFRTVLVA